MYMHVIRRQSGKLLIMANRVQHHWIRTYDDDLNNINLEDTRIYIRPHTKLEILSILNMGYSTRWVVWLLGANKIIKA